MAGGETSDAVKPELIADNGQVSGKHSDKLNIINAITSPSSGERNKNNVAKINEKRKQEIRIGPETETSTKTDTNVEDIINFFGEEAETESSGLFDNDETNGFMEPSWNINKFAPSSGFDSHEAGTGGGVLGLFEMMGKINKEATQNFDVVKLLNKSENSIKDIKHPAPSLRFDNNMQEVIQLKQRIEQNKIDEEFKKQKAAAEKKAFEEMQQKLRKEQIEKIKAEEEELRKQQMEKLKLFNLFQEDKRNDFKEDNKFEKEERQPGCLFENNKSFAIYQDE